MATDITLEELEQAIRQFRPSRCQKVLLFIQFLKYRDEAEDGHLWRTVGQHQAYRAAHAEEKPEVYESGEAFLRATEDL